MQTDTPNGSRPLKPALFALGFSAIIAQLTLMRELLCVYSGNELVIGVVLGNWLLLTGFGAWGGRTAAGLKRFDRVLDIGLLVLAVLPIATLIAIRTLRYHVFLRGATVEPTETISSCLLLLMPYCVLSGWLLAACCARIGETTGDARGVGAGYVWDCVGGLLGGLIFSFLLAPYCGHFTMLFLPAVVLTAFVGWMAFRERRNVCFAVALFLLGTLATTFSSADLDAWTTAREFAGQEVVFRGYSPYGRLVVTERAGQRDFIENGVPVFATGDPFPKKETAHLALLQRPEAKRVLLLGGGVAGTAAEILKHPIERLDYVELDPLLVDAARELMSGANAASPEARAFADPRLRIHLTDARRFVRGTTERYDAIIVDMPDPSTAQLNRFHTREFFREVRAAMAEQGVFSIALAHYENRMTPELEPLISVPFRTLIDVFDGVLILPGAQRVHFLASDGPLTSDLETRAASRPELAFYPEYIRLWLAPDRLEDLRLAARAEASLNTDLNPRLYYLHLLHTLSQFQSRYGVFLAVLAVLTALFLVRARAAQVGLFAAGFSASALNVVVLLAFQTVYGALYRDLGWLTAAFMFGLALGAAWVGRVAHASGLRSDNPEDCGTVAHATGLRDTIRRIVPRGIVPHSAYVWILLSLAVFGALLPVALWLLGRMDFPFSAPLSIYVFFPALIAVLAGLVGAAFPVAAQIDFDTSAGAASRSFFADYAGSFVGALLVSTLLIPLLGIVGTCLLTALLNLLAAGLMWSRRGQYGTQPRT